MFFTHQLNRLSHLSHPFTPLYGGLHVTLGFKQRAERGQWRIACGSGWLSASTQPRWVFFKVPALIHYCLHSLKSSHKKYCHTFFDWALEAFRLMHCSSQTVAPFLWMSNWASFPLIFHLHLSSCAIGRWRRKPLARYVFIVPWTFTTAWAREDFGW